MNPSCAVSPLDTVQSSNRITMGVGSGAAVSVWLPELFPEFATVEPEESRQGAKYFGPRDTITPTLHNLGTRQYTVSKLVIF